MTTDVSNRDVLQPAAPLQRRRHALPIPTSQSVYEWIALAFAGLPAVLGPWLFGSVRVWSVAPLVISVMIAAVMTLARPAFFRNADAFQVPRAWMGLLLFGLYAGARSFTAAVHYDAWFEVYRIASYIAAWWVWTELGMRQKRWRIIIGAFLLSATCMAWYALVQHGQESRMVLNVERPLSYGMRASGAYICPNHFANLLEMLAAAGFALACCSSAGLAVRMFGGYAVAVSLPVLYLTQSRSGWIATAVGLTVAGCVTAWRKSARHFGAVLLVAPALAALVGWLAWTFSPMVQVRVADAMHGNVRIALWRDTCSLIQSSPLWGHGPASFRWVYPEFKRHMTAYLDPQFAHNDVLHTLAEYGFAGALLLGGALATFVVLLLVRVRKLERERDASFVAGFIGALAASTAHCLFDYNFQIFANVHVLILLAGLVSAGLFASGEWKPWSTSRALSAAARSLGAAVAVAVVALSGMALVSYLENRLGDDARKQLDYETSRAQYEDAIRADRRNWNPYLGKGHLLRLQAQWNRDAATRTGQMEQARQSYEEALKRNAYQTEAMYGLSKLSAMAGDEEKSLAQLEALIQRVPYHRFYLTELGMRLREMGRYEEALRRFQEAQKVEDTDMIRRNIQLLQEKIAAGKP